MVTEITSGIRVSANATYQEEFSDPNGNNYFFAYEISIENQSDFTVQLLSRHWYIFDSSGQRSEVHGEGVIGEKPVLQPGELFTYRSACTLSTDIGKMSGNYTMQRMLDGVYFEALIPEMSLIAPYRLN